MTFLLATRISTAACLSRSRTIATATSCSIAHAATPTAGSKRCYGDTFAPTSKFSCIRSICAIAAQEGLTLYQFDVKGAFLLAECKERVDINLPGKYRLPKGTVLQCRRLIYGLKQAAHGCNHMFVKLLLDYGFVNLDNDGVTFVKNVNKNDGTQSKILLSIHVDDGLAACSDEAMYK